MTQSSKGFMQQLIHCCNQHDIKKILFIDRMHLHYDGRTTDITLEKKKFKDNELEYSDATHLDRKLELFQLRKKQLKTLKDDIKGDFKINYIELDIDFVTNNKASLDMLHTFFCQHLVKKSSNQFYFHQYEKNNTKKQTVYYNPQNDNHVTLFYYDKMSKLSKRKYCFHLEIRIKGAKKIAQHTGIVTLADAINFDYLEFFNKELDFKRVNLEKLGAIAYPSKKVSTTSRITDGKSKLKEISNAQEILSQSPAFAIAYVEPMTTASIEKKLKQYLNSTL